MVQFHFCFMEMEKSRKKQTMKRLQIKVLQVMPVSIHVISVYVYVWVIFKGQRKFVYRTFSVFVNRCKTGHRKKNQKKKCAFLYFTDLYLIIRLVLRTSTLCLPVSKCTF